MCSEMKASLEIGNKQFTLKPGIHLVGKKSSEDISDPSVPIEDESIDLKHAIIEISNDRVALYDLFSRMGTYLSGVKLQGMCKVSAKGGATLQFGAISGKLHVFSPDMSRESSGFHDDGKNLSDLGCSSPGMLSPEDAPLATPPTNELTTSKGGDLTATRSASAVGKSKTGTPVSNNLKRSSDSFIIPETQYLSRSKRSIGDNVSIPDSDCGFANMSKVNILDYDDDDCCIPETQVLPENVEKQDAAGGLPTAETLVDGSQFRICTQEYNEDFLHNESSMELLGHVQSSLVIPHIQHDPVVINELDRSLVGGAKASSVEEGFTDAPAMPDDLEVSMHNSNLKHAALTTEMDDRMDACTPDLFELPALAQQNYLEAAIAPEPAADSSPTDEDNLIATQVFDPKIHMAKKTKKDERRREPAIEPLLLSGKENEHPRALAAKANAMPLDMEATQIAPSTKTPATCLPSTPKAMQQPEEFAPLFTPLPATQVFQLPKRSCSTKVDLSAMNSTLLANVSSQLKAPNLSSFFAEIDHVQRHNTPEIETISRASSISSVSSVSADCEALMGTPQIFKDKWDACKATSGRITARHKMLFGEDSDDELATDPIFGLTMKCSENRDFEKLCLCLDKHEQRARKKFPPQKIIQRNPIFGIDRKYRNEVLANSRETRVKGGMATSEKKPNEPQKVKPATKPAKPRDTTTNQVEKKEAALMMKTLTVKKMGGETQIKSESIASKPNKRHELKAKPENLIGTSIIATGISTANNATTNNYRRSSRLRSQDKQQPKDTIKSTPEKSNCKREATLRDAASKTPASSNQARALRSQSIAKTFDMSLEVEKVTGSPLNRKPKRATQSEGNSQDLTTSPSTTNKRWLRPRSGSTKNELSVEKDKATATLLKSKIRHEVIAEEASVAHASRGKHVKVDIKPPVARPKRPKVPTEDEELRLGKPAKSKRPPSVPSEPTKASKSPLGTEFDKKRSPQFSHYSTKHQGHDVGAKPPKRKEKTPTKVSSSEELKRYRTTLVGSPAKKKLKISMTMVDPVVTKKLTQSTSDIWTLAKDPVDSDILIMDKGNRTYKFLIAVAKGIPIYTSDWLGSVTEKNKFVNPSGYLFIDDQFERRHNFQLWRTIEIARTDKLFNGCDFVVTPGVIPQPHEMKAIIECAGGTVHTKMFPAPEPNQRLYLVSSNKDKKEWHKHRRRNHNIKIVTCEGVMASVMQQQIEALNSFLLS